MSSKSPHRGSWESGEVGAVGDVVLLDFQVKYHVAQSITSPGKLGSTNSSLFWKPSLVAWGMLGFPLITVAKPYIV